MFKLIKILVPVLLISSCGMKPSIEDSKLSDREFSLEEFFDGKTKAYGQFQDILGNVSRRFTVDIKGVWDGSNLILTEDFVYEDGSEEQRIWNLVKTGENAWVGTADGVIGTANGFTSGDMFYWTYKIDLPTSSGETRVSFKDYMWMLSDKRVLNKAYMSRWGIPVGEVIIIFEGN